MGAVKSYMRGDIGGALKSVVGFGKKAMNGQSAQKQTRETKTSNADVVMWSGYVPSPLTGDSTRIDSRPCRCKDSQTSADASEAGKATGAMSWAFIEALSTSQVSSPTHRSHSLIVSLSQRNIRNSRIISC